MHGTMAKSQATEADRLQLPRRSQIAQAHKRQGGQIAAVLPIHYPRALLRAYDILPIEVWGPPGIEARQGAAHLQPYICSIVQNALSFLIDGGLEVADILMVPHACDSLQGLGSILIDFVKLEQLVLPVYIPRSGGDHSEQYLADEFRSLCLHLKAKTGRSPSDEDLFECVLREEAADRVLAELHHQARPTSGLRARYQLIRGREYLPAEDFIPLAEQALQAEPEGDDSGLPIILSGIVPEPMGIFDALSGLGANVVADDLASCGRRLYTPGESEDPFMRMAETILRAPPDSTRGSPIGDRLSHLLDLVRSNRARGVIFYPVKFCEPELFDLPHLRQGLLEAGIPTMVLEVDLNDRLSGQAHTRLEAFLEMVA